MAGNFERGEDIWVAVFRECGGGKELRSLGGNFSGGGKNVRIFGWQFLRRRDGYEDIRIIVLGPAGRM